MPILTSTSPWNGEPVASIAACTPAEIAALMQGLSDQAASWAGNRQRTERLQALASACEMRQAAIVDLLIREAGKNRGDAEAEAALLPKKIALTLEHSERRTPTATGPLPAGALSAGATRVVWRPRGVAVVLGPYNFPLHLLHGLVVPALAVGCPVAAKPSERCPALALLYRELIAAAGLDHVCAVIPGDATVAAALIDHPATATVAAVGSRAMALAVQQRLVQRPEVVLALECGGINYALVRPDADAEAAATAIADGAWRMAGQRCTATRVVLVPAAHLDAWLLRLSRCRQHWLPGSTTLTATSAATSAATGPMIDAHLREQFQLPFRQLPDGLSLVAGKPEAGSNPCACDPLLLRADDARHPFLREERFGPHLVVCPYPDESAAIAAMQANPYRLSCSIFTRDDAAFAGLAAQLHYGVVNRNRPTAGARSDLPFGGCGLSGNGRPAGIAAAAIFADETAIWS